MRFDDDVSLSPDRVCGKEMLGFSLSLSLTHTHTHTFSLSLSISPKLSSRSLSLPTSLSFTHLILLHQRLRRRFAHGMRLCKWKAKDISFTLLRNGERGGGGGGGGES